MTIEKQESFGVILHCDHCPFYLEFDYFDLAVKFIIREGWRARRNLDDDKWEHICPECRTKIIK